MQRTTYDTSVKHLIRLGLHSSLPPEMLSDIPRTNLFRWKNEDATKYHGHQLNKITNEQLELLRQFSEHRIAKRTFSAYLRILCVCRTIIRKNGMLLKVFAKAKEQLVDVIVRTEPTIGISKAIKLLGISRTTFQNWMLEIKVKCTHSYFEWCNRARPNQLTRPEVLQIKKLVSDNDFQYWPLVSIFHYAVRNHLLHVGASTFYKYVRLLGIKRVKFKKPRPRIGIRSNRPHELWHTDITIIKLDGIKLYLHLLVDNFSRCIIGWQLKQKISGSTLKEILTTALAEYTPQRVKLLVDGGCENLNTTVDDFLNTNEDVIYRLVAQKDIDFSNSMVEAVNKIVKNSYLGLMQIKTESELLSALGFIINDYNEIRPHNSLNGLTPMEALTGISVNVEKRKEQRLKARTERLEFNRKNTCGNCL